MQNPKVFISHAREDKERFVLDFAKKLREKGIDAWVDRWEILPGDSLVDKIFEEGIGKAQAFIVVLSNNSIESKWVKEELNAGMVKRIEKGSRLIPVVLDINDEQIPESLKSIVWTRVKDINAYEEELDRIIKAICDYREKPPLGDLPEYIENLEEEDTEKTEDYSQKFGHERLKDFILLKACEKTVELDSSDIDPREIFPQVASKGFSKAEFLEVLEEMDDDEIEIRSRDILAEGKPPLRIAVSHKIFECYLNKFMPDYREMERDVATCIIYGGKRRGEAIANRVHRPEVIINHILTIMYENNFFLLKGGRHWRYYVTIGLKVRSLSIKRDKIIRWLEHF